MTDQILTGLSMLSADKGEISGKEPGSFSDMVNYWSVLLNCTDLLAEKLRGRGVDWVTGNWEIFLEEHQ